ncbi:MAG TPA: glycosyl hydrolase [Candidatus Hydrogenedentes bacterium]|nr:glycosyl hydrolase [Candidatus Hydrogenedentota bacterium]HPG69687.1 glycosyl hydrolase [Candidatus Hydrogenedentota bacterium]
MALICCLITLSAAPSSAADGAPASVRLVRSFDVGGFANPEPVLWPAYFWMWNASLDEGLIKKQLEDMRSHGARSVCMLPMPREFRPDSTNNSMAPDYLTPEFFERARFALDEAARLGMNWWLYDEGGWPSGQALGKVVEGHAGFAAHQVVRERVDAHAPFPVPADALALVVEQPKRRVVGPGATWTPASADEVAHLYRVAVGGRADLLNPDATDRFIKLTHDGYREACGEHLGKTVLFTFTDEPAVPAVRPPESIPWTPNMERLFAQRYGRSVFEVLPSLFVEPSTTMDVADARARVDFYDLWTSRFAEAYFTRLQAWDRRHRLGSAGHLGGEDETLGAIRHGFGHPLRQLRAMDVPGVDLIWRQLFPGRPNQHHFPKLASSAAHYNGSRYAFTESFCVYGNGLTPAQMKWLIDYQYVRGLNLLVMGCYPLSTHDHHMTGERPHFGVMNPLWDHLPAFHAYVARLGYALSVGTPRITTALYYPVRDLWAWGMNATEAATAHDALANALLAHQCDFDLVDDDALIKGHVDGAQFVAGAMRYDAIVCGKVCWMSPGAYAQLERFAQVGGKVLCADCAPGTNGVPGTNAPAHYEVAALEDIAGRLVPTVKLEPACHDMRACVRALERAEVVMLFNEGEQFFDGEMEVGERHVYGLDAQRGTITHLEKASGRVPVRLLPGESRLFLCSEDVIDAINPPLPSNDGLTLDTDISATARRHFVVGEHDFDVTEMDSEPVSFAQATVWHDWLGGDFSGEVDYGVRFDIPEAWGAASLELTTGPIEYAATVFLDGEPVGHILWPPWRIDLPACAPGRHELVIRVANTLANELTSERVVELWNAKKGPGWPSPYHVRALEFERESRGGGLQGPIGLLRMEEPR